jgi:hypothetical protein
MNKKGMTMNAREKEDLCRYVCQTLDSDPFLFFASQERLEGTIYGHLRNLYQSESEEVLGELAEELAEIYVIYTNARYEQECEERALVREGVFA